MLDNEAPTPYHHLLHCDLKQEDDESTMITMFKTTGPRPSLSSQHKKQFGVIFNLKKKKLTRKIRWYLLTLLQIQPWDKTVDKRRPQIYKRRNICFYYLKRFY